jgi:hypothetical protein
VGDQNGFFQNFVTKGYFVENPDTVYCYNGTKPFNGACIGPGNYPVQKRWVATSQLSQEAWEAAPKTHCPDGYPTRNHRDNDCKKELISKEMKDKFEDYSGGDVKEIVVAAVVAAVALGLTVPLLHKLRVR